VRHTSTTYVHHHRTAGVTELHAELGLIDGHLFRNELARLTRQIRADDRRDGRQRSHSERLAAALTLMATRSANGRGRDRGTRAVIQVIAGDDTMRRACELASGEVLHTHELLPHLDTATFETFLFGDRSTIITASPQRRFTGALRRAIQLRDRHCQHESGCDTDALHGDIDHIVPIARAGPTSQFNGRSYCTPHNRTITTGTRHATPERHLGPLDALRARLRWQHLRRSESEERQLDLAWHITEVERLLHTPLNDEPG
jgi:5-methylcytosine-specific restriction endonuclease McrA